MHMKSDTWHLFLTASSSIRLWSVSFDILYSSFYIKIQDYTDYGLCFHIGLNCVSKCTVPCVVLWLQALPHVEIWAKIWAIWRKKDRKDLSLCCNFLQFYCKIRVWAIGVTHPSQLLLSNAHAVKQAVSKSLSGINWILQWTNPLSLKIWKVFFYSFYTYF